MRFNGFAIASLGVLKGCLAVDTTTKICPLLGPAFPMPTSLSSNALFQGATKKLESTLIDSLETGASAYGAWPFNTSTISIGMFSTAEEKLVYQYHYTDASISTGDVGTKKADQDSIYRLGSISKLLTAYLFLIQEGDFRFNDPITKYLPELAVLASNAGTQNGAEPRWGEITVGQLASHLSGLDTDYGIQTQGASAEGLPALPDDQFPNCNILEPDGSFIPCTAQEYLHGVVKEPALFRSGSSPIYSNNGYQLLGLVLENITDTSMEDLFTKSILEPLQLRRTSYATPNDTRNAVIPVNKTISGWDSQMGILGFGGVYYSTTKEVATIGKAILNSTLLSPAKTRRWMKPASFTAGLNVAVGHAWEIFRTQVGGRTVDLYTKNGGWGAYATIIVLVPDYNFGFSILTASALGESPVPVFMLSDMVGSAILPVLEEVARQQANSTFGGHYVASKLNSSLTISIDDQPGLKVTKWISNGTEFLEGQFGVDTSTGAYVDFRLQPNDLYSGNQVGFTGSPQVMPTAVYSGPFDLNCMTWGGGGFLDYANTPLGEFVFQIDPTGKRATSIQPKALRVSLDRKE